MLPLASTLSPTIEFLNTPRIEELDVYGGVGIVMQQFLLMDEIINIYSDLDKKIIEFRSDVFMVFEDE